MSRQYKNFFLSVNHSNSFKTAFRVSVLSCFRNIHAPYSAGHSVDNDISSRLCFSSVDNFFIGKEIGKYVIGLSSENAFGKRRRESVKMIPIKVFFQHKINPVQGAMLNFDGKMGKVLSVSGGRVLVDFNHPLAGKDVIYEVNIKKIIQNIDEKIKAFNSFIFKQDFKFSVDNKKVIYELQESDKQLKIFVGIFKEKFKEIFGMELEIRGDKDKESENFLTSSPSNSGNQTKETKQVLKKENK